MHCGVSKKKAVICYFITYTFAFDIKKNKTQQKM